ncbi:thioredoxin family protein [Merismopedia glauca]|uniref:Thiol:disulfide interchange protein n=1 Tax=Merismopedia glauca CCAP 1448/3 TaxID=1296344 RepID=A0A2T1C3J2_9CYAN|nr:thioredoxin family protein [Merismopedia glauca]PSB02845.1 thiol:disulfide interchange protein [Merismopedia glauca CCAP 1448/3]
MAANLPESNSAPSDPRWRNFIIAMAAIALAIALSLGFRTQTPTTTLETLATKAVPIDVAVNNGKPTLIEFYANWCTTCQAMAEDVSKLKTEYGDKLNFVMLNVDNTKWLPEITRYRVDGIPHFVYLNPQGESVAETIGEIPRLIMAANLDALIANSSLPYAKASGQISAFAPKIMPSQSNTDDPRSHSSQVKSEN